MTAIATGTTPTAWKRGPGETAADVGKASARNAAIVGGVIGGLATWDAISSGEVRGGTGRKVLAVVTGVVATGAVLGTVGGVFGGAVGFTTGGNGSAGAGIATGAGMGLLLGAGMLALGARMGDNGGRVTLGPIADVLIGAPILGALAAWPIAARND